MMRRRFFRPRPVQGARRKVAEPAESPPGVAPAGDARFRSLILPHLDAAFNLARYLARDASAAEDIVQSAFLRALRGFAAWRGDNARAWLLAIVRNAAMDWLKGRSGETTYDEQVHSAPVVVEATVEIVDTDTPHAILVRREAAEIARAAVEALPKPFREIIVLREFEEMSYRDIAAICEVPIGTVMSRLARGRQLLAEMLLPAGEGERGVCA